MAAPAPTRYFGGAGNDVHFVDDAGDQAIENANEGNDVVFSSAHVRLTANVENLILQGSANLQGYGNSLNNSIYGNTGRPTRCLAAPATTPISLTRAATL